MPLVDHNHQHRFERAGVIRSRDVRGVEIVYQCTECSAWTTVEKKRSAHVPPRSGRFPEHDVEGGDGDA